MSFTLTFSPAISPPNPISVPGCSFTSSDGITYTTSDTPTNLGGFSGQSWSNNLVSVQNIPSSVTHLDNNCFSNCSSLASIVIPTSVTNIYFAAFYNCPSLSSVTFVSGGSITSIDSFTFAYCSSLNSLSIPNGVTTIGNNAFQNCSSISSITIPNNVTSINDVAFYNCSALSSITIPTSVNSIGNQAFLYIPNSSSTVITTPITPIPSFAYTWFQTSPDYSTFYNNITFLNPPSPPIICFKEDTKILTDKGYIPIQNLRKSDLVKTINHDYVPINVIGKRDIYHPALKERIKDQLYKCCQSEYPEIFEDLVITGCHAILVDEFKEDQREKTNEILGKIFVTDRKYRLPVCVDEKASVYEVSGDYTIYHIALDNDDYRMNYGIYANGLLVESCSIRHLKELSNMTYLS